MLLGYIVSLDEFGQPIRSDGLALTVADWVSVGYTPEAAARYVAEFDAGVDHSPAPTLATARYVPYGVDSQGGATWQDYYSKRVMPDGFWPIKSEMGYQHRDGTIGVMGDAEWIAGIAAMNRAGAGMFGSFGQALKEAMPGIMLIVGAGALFSMVAAQLAATGVIADTGAVSFDAFASGLAEDAGVSQSVFEATNLQAGLTASGAAMPDIARTVVENVAKQVAREHSAVSFDSYASGLAEDAGVSQAAFEAGNLQAGLTASGATLPAVLPAAPAAPSTPWQIPGVPAIPTGAASAAAALLKALTGATAATAPRPVTTPPYIPGVTGPPIDTTAPNPQSIQAMLPWLAIAAFGVVALKGK